MKNTKHTPGPWLVRFENSTNILDQTLEIVSAEPTKLGDQAHVATLSVTTLRADPQKDAALIAAAPEMLQLLEQTLNQLHGMDVYLRHETTHPLVGLALELESLIKKARGES